MLNFFLTQIDYLDFIKGLFFMFFGGACLLYHAKERLNPFLFPLVLYSFFQALLSWSHHLVHAFVANVHDVHHYAHAAQLLSYISLLVIWPSFLLRGRKAATAYTWLSMLGFGGVLIILGHSQAFEIFSSLTMVLATILSIVAILRYRKHSGIRAPSFTSISVLIAATAFLQSGYSSLAVEILTDAEQVETLVALAHTLVVLATAVIVWLDIILYTEDGEAQFLPARLVARSHRIRYGSWLGLSLVLVVVVGWHGVQILSAGAVASVKTRTQSAAEILSNQIRDEIARADLAANILAKSNTVPAVFTDPASEHREVKIILDQLSSVLESSVAFLMRPDGHVPLASTKAERLAGSNFGFLPYFQESVAYGLVGRDFAVEPNLIDRGYYVSHPVFAKEQGLVGVAVVKKLLAQGNREFKDFKNWFVLDPNGVIFISPREELLLKSLWNFPETIKRELIRVGHLGPGPFDPILDREVDNGAEINFEGESSVLAKIEINDSKWKAVVIGNFSKDVQLQRVSGIGVTLFVSLFILTYFIVAQREAVFEQKMAEDKIRLEALNDQLELQAATDRLTGALNRHKFEEILKEEVERTNRHQTPFSLTLFDIDHFKAVNDTFGHQAGDDVLKELAQLVRNELRTQDRLIRWGGEEFIVMMPMTDLEGGRVLAERLRQKIESHAFSHGKQVTSSFGLGQYDGDSPAAYLHRIDEALYCAKEGGRNQVREMAGREESG
jgi:diguanylate cyclase (GGDEF)-like protein